MGKTDAPKHLVVGHLNKPHGMKGEVFIWPLTDHPESMFAPGVVLYLGDSEGVVAPELGTRRIETSRAYRRGYLVRFEGVYDRMGSEALCGRYVLTEMDGVADLEPGEVFYHDLLGMEVVTLDGSSLGEVTEVYEVRPADLLEIQGADKSILIPYISEMVSSVSVEENRIVLDPPEGLLDV
jgi:16S rRNA processing protein RimM